MPKISAVECSLCKTSVLENCVIDHLTTCVYYSFYNRPYNAPINNIYKTYYFTAFILDLIEDFDSVLQLMPQSKKSIVWDIYGFIHANRKGNGYSNIGIGLDDICRLAISKHDAACCRELNLIRNINVEHFNACAIDLRILFDEQQIRNLLK